MQTMLQKNCYCMLLSNFDSLLFCYLLKVEEILKGNLDLIPSPSPSVKIQIMGGKVCLRYKGKTLLVIVNKFLKTKSLFTSHPCITQYLILCLVTLDKLSCQQFEFPLKVKVMGSNPDYLLKSFLLYIQFLPGWSGKI